MSGAEGRDTSLAPLLDYRPALVGGQGIGRESSARIERGEVDTALTGIAAAGWYAVDGERGLRDVRREHELASERRVERTILLVALETTVQGADRHAVISEGCAACSNILDLAYTGKEHQGVAGW